MNLTPREAQVLGLVAYGHTTAEIAEALGLSKRTVEMHRAGGMRRLGISSRRQVVQWAIASGHLDTHASAAVDALEVEAHKELNREDAACGIRRGPEPPPHGA